MKKGAVFPGSRLGQGRAHGKRRKRAKLFRADAAAAGARAAGAAGGLFFLLLFAGFLDEGLARKAYLIALDRKHLDEDLVAELQLVANVADAMLGDFADVEQ